MSYESREPWETGSRKSPKERWLSYHGGCEINDLRYLDDVVAGRHRSRGPLPVIIYGSYINVRADSHSASQSTPSFLQDCATSLHPQSQSNMVASPSKIGNYHCFLLFRRADA